MDRRLQPKPRGTAALGQQAAEISDRRFQRDVRREKGRPGFLDSPALAATLKIEHDHLGVAIRAQTHLPFDRRDHVEACFAFGAVPVNAKRPYRGARDHRHGAPAGLVLPEHQAAHLLPARRGKTASLEIQPDEPAHGFRRPPLLGRYGEATQRQKNGERAQERDRGEVGATKGGRVADILVGMTRGSKRDALGWHGATVPGQGSSSARSPGPARWQIAAAAASSPARIDAPS